MQEASPSSQARAAGLFALAEDAYAEAARAAFGTEEGRRLWVLSDDCSRSANTLRRVALRAGLNHHAN